MTRIRLVLAMVGVLPLALACAPSLEASRAARVPEVGTPGAAGANRDSEHCRKLSNQERALRKTTVALVSLSGASAAGAGITSIEVDDQTATTALAISGAVFAVGAGVTGSLREEVASDWAEDCP
jgi:hypothetical protein